MPRLLKRNKNFINFQLQSYNSFGFTLIELMIVITIIGILTLIGYATYSNAQKGVRDSRRKADIDAIAQAYEANYNGVNNRYKALSTSDFVNGNTPHPPENSTGYYDGFNSTQFFDPTKQDQGTSWMVCARLEGQTSQCTSSSSTCYCRTNTQGNQIALSSQQLSTSGTNTIGPSSGNLLLSGVPSSLQDGWTTIKTVTINNTTGSLSNYQVKVSVPYKTGMKSDFGDIRFANSAGTAELPYYIESYTPSASAIVWVNDPTVPNGSSTFNLVYGNSTTTTTSNANSTFDLYDDFTSSSLDTTKWNYVTLNGGAGDSVTVSGGAITISGTATNSVAAIKSKAGFSNPLITEAKINSVSGNYTGQYLLFSNSGVWNGYMMFLYYGNTYIYQSMVSASTSCAGIWSNWENYLYYSSLPSEAGIWKLVWLGGSQYSDTWPNGQTLSLFSSTYSLSNFNVGAGITTCGNSPNTISIDWIRVRKYASAEPTASIAP